jgi:hypothetical protein
MLASSSSGHPRVPLYMSLARAIAESALVAWVVLLICAVTQLSVKTWTQSIVAVSVVGAVSRLYRLMNHIRLLSGSCSRRCTHSSGESSSSDKAAVV